MEAVVASFTQMEQITAALEKAVEFKENKLERALEQFGARFEALETLWETSFGSRSSTARSARSGGLARAATMEAPSSGSGVPRAGSAEACDHRKGGNHEVRGDYAVRGSLQQRRPLQQR